MDLLQKMLEPNPEIRLSAEEALKHSALHQELSRSPLVMKKIFNIDELIQHTFIVDEYSKKP